MPALDQTTFFIVMAVLQALDSITTYQAIKSGKGEEDNGFVASVMRKAGSVKAGLWIVKLAVLGLLWAYPLTEAWAQWSLIGVYVAVVINNARIWRKGR